MRVTLKSLLNVAYGKFAVGAYNINNLEQCVGLFRGNLGKLKGIDDPVDPAIAAPFVLQISRGARKYTDKRFLEALIRAAEEVFPEAIFVVHLDHGDEQTCYDCIDSGLYTSVMIDASDKPFEENVAITKRVVERAHEKGISVEAELGQLGGIEEDIVGESPRLTDPNQAVEFVKETGCDALAVAIGTSHGAYKFSGKPNLRFDVAREIKMKLAEAGFENFPLVLHGASAVPKHLVDRVNNAGGAIKDARGVPEEQYLQAVECGVAKINIDTDGRLVWCAVHRESFRDDPANFDLRKPGKKFMDEYASFIADKNRKLGSAGKLEEVRRALEAQAVA